MVVISSVTMHLKKYVNDLNESSVKKEMGLLYILILLLSLNSSTAGAGNNSDYTVYKTSETTYKIYVDVNNPVFYGGWAMILNAYNRNSIIPAYSTPPPGHASMPDAQYYECPQSKIFPHQAFTDVNHADHETAIRTVLETLNSCTFAYTATINSGQAEPSWNTFRINVGVSSSSYFVNIDLHAGSIGPEPSQCSAQIPEPLDFGVVKGGGTYVSETNMYVKCSNKTSFDIKVNNSREFIDPESGTRIAFEDFSTGSLALDCKDGCTIPIPGEMTAAPTKPGKYQWAVPVIVEYK